MRGGGLERRKRFVFDLTFWRGLMLVYDGKIDCFVLEDRAGLRLREVKLVAVGGRFDFVVIGPRFVKSACRGAS